MVGHIGRLARAFDRLAGNDRLYFLRLDLNCEPEKLPAGVSVREDRITGTFVVSASGRKGEILKVLEAVKIPKNELVKCIIRDSRDSMYLCLLADGRIVIDRKRRRCGFSCIE